MKANEIVVGRKYVRGKDERMVDEIWPSAHGPMVKYFAWTGENPNGNPIVIHAYATLAEFAEWATKEA